MIPEMQSAIGNVGQDYGQSSTGPQRVPESRPSREQVIMQVAYSIAQRSTCGRLNVGAVIVMEGRIVSTGYNGAPAGLPHCDHTCDCGIRPEDARLEIHKWGCSAEPGCQQAVHAESNAIAFAARYGLVTEGAELFTTHTPCLSCSMLIINSGIRTVYSAIEYRDTSGVDMLSKANIPVRIL